MASPALFEKTHFSAKSARQITEPPNISVTSQHRDIGGCYYGKGLEGNPRDPWNFTMQDKALLEFIKKQTPYRERTLIANDVRRDAFLHQRAPDGAEIEYERISPDDEPPHVDTRRSMSPFARQTTEEKKRIQEARRVSEEQANMKREMEEGQKGLENDPGVMWDDQLPGDTFVSPLAAYRTKSPKPKKSPTRKFTKDLTNTRPKPRVGLKETMHGLVQVDKSRDLQTPPKTSKKDEVDGHADHKKEEVTLSMKLKENIVDKLEKAEAELRVFGRKGSPFKPRIGRGRDDDEKKRMREADEKERIIPYGHRRTADDPNMGFVKTPLEEAKEHCDMMIHMTPQRTKFQWKMGLQYRSPFEDPEPMRIFEEKRAGSPAPSMTGWLGRNDL
jgi:hypothetical protein